MEGVRGVAASSEDREGGEGETMASSGLSAGYSMKELAARSRLVMIPYPKPKPKEAVEQRYSLEPDGIPLAALTQVQRVL